MVFIYGENDWVSRAPADRLIDGGLVQGGVYQTANSGHHLYLEAAEESVACILKFLQGEKVANEFIDNVIQAEEELKWRVF